MQTALTKQPPSRSGSKPSVRGWAWSSRRAGEPRLEKVGLVERLVELQQRHVVLNLFAAEALPLVLDSFGAAAGALLLYRPEDESLTLVGERGLSHAGRKNLALLKRGAGGSWEIPLHGLVNRRAYIIEHPHQHPFVPELVSPADMPSLLNLALIPLYCGAVPVGVALVLVDKRPLANEDILMRVAVLDVLSVALDSLARRADRRPSNAAAVSDTTGRTASSAACE